MTKDSEKAFKIIFCEYKRLRNAGFTKDDSRFFADGSLSKNKAFSSWLSPDIQSAIDELKENGFISENICNDITITNAGIEYMENKPKDFFKDLSGLFDLVSILI